MEPDPRDPILGILGGMLYGPYREARGVLGRIGRWAKDNPRDAARVAAEMAVDISKAGPAKAVFFDTPRDLMQGRPGSAAFNLGTGVLEMAALPLAVGAGTVRAVRKADRLAGAIEDMSTAARAADRVSSSGVAPRVAQGIEGVQTAGTRGRGIKSVRELPQAEAINQARRGAHLVRKPDGSYVGAPSWVQSPQQLRQMRRNLDRMAEEGTVGKDWYDRTEAGNRAIAGPYADRTALLSAEEGLWSAQATPDTNFGFVLRGHNPYEFGAPLEQVRTRRQAEKYSAARDAGGVPDLGPKTGVYGGHLDPFVESPITGTNDIWHARAFGYTGGGANDSFSRGLTAQEHAFMDAETLLAAERLNARQAGGRTDWDGRGTQAAIWVRMKGQSLADKRKSLDGDLARGMEEAAKTYPDYFDKYSISATRESIPGRNTEHLPGLLDTDWATRTSYTDAVPWTTASGNDAIYEALGMYNQPTTNAVGYYDGDTNPMRVARPLVPRVSGGQSIDPVSRSVVEAAENLRGLLDAQNSAGFSQVIPDLNPVSARTSLYSPGAVTPDVINRATEALPTHFAIDTGGGLLMLASDKSPASSAILRNLNKGKYDALDLGEGISRVGADSGYIDILNSPGSTPGSQTATRALMDRVDALSEMAPAVANNLSADPIRVRAGLLADRDAALASRFGGVRDDVQNFRRAFASGGLLGVRRALESGVPLPIFAGLGLGLAAQRQGGREYGG